jgi:hypothetical protein
VFGWKPSDMTEVPRDLSKHCLNIYPGKTYSAEEAWYECIKE